MPEFANVKRQLEGLEDRLEGMVQPRLADALTQRKVWFCSNACSEHLQGQSYDLFYPL